MYANDYGQYVKLRQKTRNLSDLIASLNEINAQLERDASSAASWGQSRVVCLALLIPANIILNAFEVKAAQSLYESVVQEAYKKFAASGKNTDGNVGKALAATKQALVHVLKQKSKEMIPVANILFGLAEDGMALYQAAATLSDGKKETHQLTQNIIANINRANSEILKLGIQLNEILERHHFGVANRAVA